MFEQSAEIDKLVGALSKAQAQFKRVETASLNPHFKSKFASFADIMEQALPILTAHGLSITQHPVVSGGVFVSAGSAGTMGLVTQLQHTSGQWQRSRMEVPLSKMDAQGAGSCVTYMKRYAASGILGITTGDVDDDGNEASAPSKAPPAKKEEVDTEGLLKLIALATTEEELKKKVGPALRKANGHLLPEISNAFAVKLSQLKK